MANGKRILVVEDAEDLATVLRDRFRREGYCVDTVQDGESALHTTEQAGFDLILLDLMLPGISGFDVCRELRKRNHATPILMLTARNETVDKIVGLRLGADDYVTKPFDMGELLARVEALLRRSSHGCTIPEGRLTFGDIEVDLPKGQLSPSARRAYAAPFADRSQRHHQTDLFRSVAAGQDFLANLELRSKDIADLPVLIMFGDMDATYQLGWHERLALMFPKHRIDSIRGGHHFPQEYAPDRFADVIQQWYADVVQPDCPRGTHR
jgi:CheY-like chemotaxis protein